MEKKSEDSKQEVKQIESGKEAAMEAEVKAARERAIIPLEIRMKQFRDMLTEKEVGQAFKQCIFSASFDWFFLTLWY